MMLDNYVRDFKALIDWIQLQEKFEKTDAQNRRVVLIFFPSYFFIIFFHRYLSFCFVSKSHSFLILNCSVVKWKCGCLVLCFESQTE